jgi:hypothetical protein
VSLRESFQSEPEDAQEMEWLERELYKRFPDDLNIPVGQLRVRIFLLCLQFTRLLKQKDKENRL